ncbi:MAG: hypothetical protein AB1489_29200 [Acidobacteriota bacterium]
MTQDERLKLTCTLKGLPSQQLDDIIFMLNPPSGLVPPILAPQGDRVSALLGWAESSSGRGLAEVQLALSKVLGHASNHQIVLIHRELSATHKYSDNEPDSLEWVFYTHLSITSIDHQPLTIESEKRRAWFEIPGLIKKIYFSRLAISNIDKYSDGSGYAESFCMRDMKWLKVIPGERFYIEAQIRLPVVDTNLFGKALIGLLIEWVHSNQDSKVEEQLSFHGRCDIKMSKRYCWY